jgi:putative hemolysin
LVEAPNRFLSTVQIGITLVGIVAGAFGGASLSARLAPVLAPLPVVGPAAETVAFLFVIALLTYFSLIIGELVPKRLAMLRPEAISAAMARPMAALSTLASPVVTFLSASTDLLLRLFGVRAEEKKGVSREEVTVLIREGMVAGSIGRSETAMVEGVFNLNELTAVEIMTPRPRIVWLQKDAPHETVWHKIVASDLSYFPVFEEARDRVVGVISVKALYAQFAGGVAVHFSEIMAQPLFVPEGQSAAKLLESFQKSGVHVALVVDEFGGIAGMVTVLDVLEAVVGDLRSRESTRHGDLRPRDDGSWVLDALLEVEAVAARLPGFAVPEGAGEDFQTVAGFLTDRLGHVPREGDSFAHGRWLLEVIDTDGPRVDKVLAVPAAAATEDAPQPPLAA